MIVTNDIKQELNSGVIILKNDQWSLNFFEAVWESRNDYIPGKSI